MLSSTALTGGIAVLAVVDLGLALKPLDAPSLRGKERARFGFRGSGAGRRSSLCRSVCIACFVSLAVALVITHQELSGHRHELALGVPGSLPGVRRPRLPFPASAPCKLPSVDGRPLSERQLAKTRSYEGYQDPLTARGFPG